jgi:hypothetical protein
MEQDGTDTIDGNGNLNQVLDGFLDSLRFSNVIRSDAWIDFEYENMANPTAVYSTTTSSEIAIANVTIEGLPATFWLFTGGSGSIYGEAYDNDDGDPGSIQWDDSNYNITISGTVYADDGVTPLGYPVCNGSTEVVTVVVDGTDTYRSACDAGDG